MIAFGAAASEFGVPAPLLLSLSYNESLWEQHGGLPSTSGGYGLMQLTHVDSLRDVGLKDGRPMSRTVSTAGRLRFHTLDLAARLLQEQPVLLERDPVQNIRGAAALLAHLERPVRARAARTLGSWYGAIVRYSSFTGPSSLLLADDVYATIRMGVHRTISSGEHMAIAPESVALPAWAAHRRQLAAPAGPKPECPTKLDCRFVPAAYAVNKATDPTDYGNYDVATRPSSGPAIRYIVIHDTEGSYDSAVATFGDPHRYASANYVIRSADGQVTQMVSTKDIAWHAGNYFVNQHAIGIEHEGVAIDGATWYTEALYRASARLVRYLANRFSIPLDRAHIVGHDDVPGPTAATQGAQHWDPGPYWDWGHYMDLLGAPIGADSYKTKGDVMTINPPFADNQPDVSFCSAPAACRSLPAQPSNFVYLHTAPDPSSPLLGDSALHPSGVPGTTRADDWGDKAVAGQKFYLVDSQGDWDAIDYGGQEAWFYDPSDAPNAVPDVGTLVTPRAGKTSIPVFGRAYPDARAYPSSVTPEKIVPLQYTIPSGQVYVATDLLRSDYYYSPTQKHHQTIVGHTRYYQIFFNHRFAFVKYSDVDVVK